MIALKLSIATSELAQRMRERLRGAGSTTASNIVWQRQANQRVLIYTDTLNVRSVDGWLLCDLGVQTDQTGRCTLQFVFFLGRQGEGDGPRAATTINAPNRPAAQVADRWGADIQRVLWDAVLDAVEASVQHAGTQRPGEQLMLGGFHCDGSAVHVDVLAGEL